MMFSVVSSKKYKIYKQAEAQLQSILSDLDWFLRNKEVIRAYYPYNGDGSVSYKILDWGATEDEEDIINFNGRAEKFNGLYLNGSKTNLRHIMVTIEEAEKREAERLAQRESNTHTVDTEEGGEKPDLSYPTPETMGLVADLKSQRAQIKECLEVGICPKCGNKSNLYHKCALCGWDWEEED